MSVLYWFLEMWSGCLRATIWLSVCKHGFLAKQIARVERYYNHSNNNVGPFDGFIDKTFFGVLGGDSIARNVSLL